MFNLLLLSSRRPSRFGSSHQSTLQVWASPEQAIPPVALPKEASLAKHISAPSIIKTNNILLWKANQIHFWKIWFGWPNEGSLPVSLRAHRCVHAYSRFRWLLAPVVPQQSHYDMLWVTLELSKRMRAWHLDYNWMFTEHLIPSK